MELHESVCCGEKSWNFHGGIYADMFYARRIYADRFYARNGFMQNRGFAKEGQKGIAAAEDLGNLYIVF